MPSASWILQQALYQLLSTDAALTTLLGAPRIYDHVSPRPTFPYITIGQTTVRDWSTATDIGEEHQLTLHVWSRAGGRRETHEIMSAIRAAVDHAELPLTGYRLINLLHEFSETRRDPDGETFHGVVRFRAVTEAA